MRRFTLHPSLVLGYPPIDDEHRFLVGIINDFIRSPDDETVEECYERTKYFVDEMTKHLAKEVGLLRDLGYPGSDGHEEFHNHVKKELGKLLEQVKENKCLGLHKVDFVNDVIWVFLEDAMREDLKAKPFLLKIGAAKEQGYDDFMKWDSSVEVGVPSIDDDHRNIVSWLNHLNEAGSSGIPHHALGNILDLLVDFIVLHFRREEGAMAACGYPNLEAHKGEHREFEKRVLDIQRRFHEGDETIIDEEVMEFIKKWLVDHILNVDTLMAPCVRGNPEAIAAAEEITIEKLKSPF